MATTRASSCGCECTINGAEGNMTGRATLEPVRNWWPDHRMEPRTDFVSERHRTALMWKL